jgi:predicted TIM-barrel fold metal-dependent hydrolase
VSSIDASVAEINRAVAKGHKGVVLPPIPQLLRKDAAHVNDPQRDPIWRAIEEAGVPLCIHASESDELQMAPYEGYTPAVSDAFRAITRPTTQATIVGNMLMSRALRNFPKMKMVFAESGLGWIVFALELSDHQFERLDLHKRGYDLIPSDVFKRQCFLTSWYDRDALVHAKGHVGADHILWSTNFPLTTSTWPNSRNTIARCFEGVADGEREQMLWGNAAKLYRL